MRGLWESVGNLKMTTINDDDKIPRCVWGEKIVGKHSHRVYKIEKFRYTSESNLVWIREEISGHLSVITLDQLFENFGHYIPWYVIGGRRWAKRLN